MNVVKRSFLTTFFLFINCHRSVINIAGTKPWSGCTQATKTDLNCRFIPKDIPDGIKRVYLQQEETGRPLPKVVTKGMFTAKNWNEIEYLEFKYEHNPLKKIDSNGLSNLLNLRELHVHADFLDELHSDAFVGLGKLQVLDLSTCPSLSTGNLMQALNGSGKLPNMQKLSIVWMNSYYGGIEIGPEMYEILRTKQLKSLDISNCDIAFLDLQGIQKLTKLQRVIATSIKLARYNNINYTDTTLNLKLLNLSYATVPDYLIGTLSYLRSQSDLEFTIQVDHLKPISNLETVDLSNIVKHDIPFQIRNGTLIVKTSLNWSINHINLNSNNFQYLDLKIVLSGCSHLESLDVSNNQMRFIHPDIIKQCKKLKHIDLSHNSLNQMANYNNSYFKNLTSSYFNMTSINLSNNKLESIPEDFFLSNKFLEIIELSNNLLNQVEFHMEHMLNLKRLDLSNNGISVLSTNSIQRLQAMVDSRTNKSTLQNLLDLRNNPFSCEQCETINSVKWILETNLVDVQEQHLLCRNENGKSVPISKVVLTELEKMCERPSRITRTVFLSTFLPLVTIVFIFITIFLIKKYKHQQKYDKVMKDKVRLIQKNKADTRYLVFVSYSSADEMFVQKFVYPELTRHLKQRTKTDRELVCIGDKHFRLGKMISDEMVHCLRQSAVMLILVSKNYCHSVYCRNEFDQAKLLEKPIILMFKEEVEQCEMPDMMKEVFTRYSRVLWECKDGKPVLKTTWENVCTSILELMG